MNIYILLSARGGGGRFGDKKITPFKIKKSLSMSKQKVVLLPRSSSSCIIIIIIIIICILLHLGLVTTTAAFLYHSSSSPFVLVSRITTTTTTTTTTTRSRCRYRHRYTTIRTTISNDYYAGDDNDYETTMRSKQQQQQQQYVFASQKARREEDQRRIARQQERFATPGVSSAIPGARNLEMNIDETELEYIQSLGEEGDDNENDVNIDKYVALWTEEGLSHLRMLRFTEAYTSFQKVYQIKPEAYLWQEGVLKYYFEDYAGAMESLTKNAYRYESRFHEPASEERIWKDAAELKLQWQSSSTFDGRRRRRTEKKNYREPTTIPAAIQGVPPRVLPQPSYDDDDNNDNDDGLDEEQYEANSIASERRKVLRVARQLFSNSLRNNCAGVALARSQLQILCGDSFPPSLLKFSTPSSSSSSSSSRLAEQQYTTTTSQQPIITNNTDRKMYKLHSLFYLGLHYDALGDIYESRECMKRALQLCADKISGNSQDITYLFPAIHMTIRDWYDDDDDFLEEDVNDSLLVSVLPKQGENESTRQSLHNNTTTNNNNNTTNNNNNNSNNVQRDRILQSMRVVDLKLELKKRNLKVSGSKKEMIDRLRMASWGGDDNTTSLTP